MKIKDESIRNIFAHDINHKMIGELYVVSMIDSEQWEVTDDYYFNEFVKNAIFPIRIEWNGMIKIPFLKYNSIDINFKRISSREEMCRIFESFVGGLGYVGYRVD